MEKKNKLIIAIMILYAIGILAVTWGILLGDLNLAEWEIIILILATIIAIVLIILNLKNIFKTKNASSSKTDSNGLKLDSDNYRKGSNGLKLDSNDSKGDFNDSTLDSKIAIDVKNVSMDFQISGEKIDNLKEYVIKSIKGEIVKEDFHALSDVSFQVKKGDKLGIIGLNGAGKSTLLKIIAGVMKPSKGSVKVRGKIAPLLELGAGFDNNYTGAENIFLNGAILGFSKSFIESKYDEIVEFADLGHFINVPIKNYSSGMRSKLGFSVATLVKPDVLLLDEVLSVGDVKFRKKSKEKIEELFNSGATVVLVSHGIKNIREICNQAVWLDQGKLIMSGPVEEVCDAYEKINDE